MIIMVVISPPSFPPASKDEEQSFNSFRDHLNYSTSELSLLGHLSIYITSEFELICTTMDEFFSHQEVVFLQVVEQKPQPI